MLILMLRTKVPGNEGSRVRKFQLPAGVHCYCYWTIRCHRRL